MLWCYESLIVNRRIRLHQNIALGVVNGELSLNCSNELEISIYFPPLWYWHSSIMQKCMRTFKLLPLFSSKSSALKRSKTKATALHAPFDVLNETLFPQVLPSLYKHFSEICHCYTKAMISFFCFRVFPIYRFEVLQAFFTRIVASIYREAKACDVYDFQLLDNISHE